MRELREVDAEARGVVKYLRNVEKLADVVELMALMTFVIVMAIYWHALLLWLKGVKFVPHPKRVTPAQTQAPAPS